MKRKYINARYQTSLLVFRLSSFDEIDVIRDCESDHQIASVLNPKLTVSMRVVLTLVGHINAANVTEKDTMRIHVKSPAW